jgi:hypothetical protein
MNLLSHLPKKFNELSESQVMEVISNYAQENRYEEGIKTPLESPKKYFERMYYPYNVLIHYFNQWQQ